MNSGRLGFGRRVGYAAGGYVGSAPAAGPGGGGTVVQVMNSTGQPAETKTGTTPDGRELVQVLIGKVAKDMREGGILAKTMESTYGVSRRGR